MKRSQTSEKRYRQRVLSLFLAVVMLASIGLLPTSKVQAAETAGTTITSMSYFSAADGPVITKSGVGQASYGFVMPIFNGGAATWNDVAQDLGVKVKVNGSWVDID
ncbi:glycoside hydrolase family 16 protein, partial [Clostridium perfringens]